MLPSFVSSQSAKRPSIIPHKPDLLRKELLHDAALVLGQERALAAQGVEFGIDRAQEGGDFALFFSVWKEDFKLSISCK